MNRIAINLASLYFVGLEPGGVVVFIDGEGDEIRLYVNGQPGGIEAAIGEIRKAVKAMDAASGYHPDSKIDPRD